MRDIHYGIIWFVGIVLGLVNFLMENLCSTLGIHCFLLEIIETIGKTNHQYKVLATFSPKSYLLICNYVRKRRDWLSSGNPILMETIGFVFFFSGVGRASQSASPPGHPLSRLALPDSLGRQQEAKLTATKSVKPKNRKPPQKNNTCTETGKLYHIHFDRNY